MTPKEKAIELVDRYYSLFSIELENTVDITEAQKCALISADEVLNALDENQWQNKLFIDYWYEVKQEIEKL